MALDLKTAWDKVESNQSEPICGTSKMSANTSRTRITDLFSVEEIAEEQLSQLKIADGIGHN